MDKATADACIDEALDALPEAVQDTIGELMIHVARDRHDRQTLNIAAFQAGLRRVVVPKDFRGMYIGTPLGATDDEAENVDRPTGVIVLNAAMLRDEQDVCDTLLHEIAHSLGFDEAEVSALGLE